MRLPASLQAVALRVIDHAPPIRDLVVIGISDPDAPLSDEPLDQFLRLRPPGTRDGPLAIGRPRLSRHRRLTAAGNRRVVVDHQEPTIPLGIGRTPVTRHPGSSALVGKGQRTSHFDQADRRCTVSSPRRAASPPTKSKGGPPAVGVPGTFLGLPAPSTGTSVKQPKGHSHSSAGATRPSRQATALAGLFRDI